MLTVKKQKIILIALIVLMGCLCFLSDLYAEQRTEKNNLTCKYFDGLKKNTDCTRVNNGTNIDVMPGGKYGSLYKTVIQLLKKTKEGREVLKESGGNISVEGYVVDLNNDGKEEAILFPNGKLRGASGNGDILVFKYKYGKKTSTWQLIGILSGNMVHIEPLKSNGYQNLIANWTIGVEYNILIRYKMNADSGTYIQHSHKKVNCAIASQSCFFTTGARHKLRK